MRRIGRISFALLLAGFAVRRHGGEPPAAGSADRRQRNLRRGPDRSGELHADHRGAGVERAAAAVAMVGTVRHLAGAQGDRYSQPGGGATRRTGEGAGRAQPAGGGLSGATVRGDGGRRRQGRGVVAARARQRRRHCLDRQPLRNRCAELLCGCLRPPRRPDLHIQSARRRVAHPFRRARLPGERPHRVLAGTRRLPAGERRAGGGIHLGRRPRSTGDEMDAAIRAAEQGRDHIGSRTTASR